MASMLTQEVKPRQWTSADYYQMADMGLFQDQRVELIEGEIIDMPPQLDKHYWTIMLVSRALERALGEGFVVRQQGPLDLSDRSIPEPDVAVVAGNLRQLMSQGHPTSALLVVEVSQTTIRFDRTQKASMYARHDIADYWIINLIDQIIEVYRDPVPDAEAPYGFAYASRQTYRRGQQVALLAKPECSIRVDDCLA